MNSLFARFGFILKSSKVPSEYWIRPFSTLRLARNPGMAKMETPSGGSPQLNTEILPVDPLQISGTTEMNFSESLLETDDWVLKIDPSSQDAVYLQRAARELRETDIPVAFPTETVYGLGADVTRSSAVLGIFKAKQRPSDNPLIVHVSSLQQLRGILNPKSVFSKQQDNVSDQNGTRNSAEQNKAFDDECIPAIYRPLISKFWPGPLSLIMPVPSEGSILAPEVTAGLDTFGVRMPQNAVALALIKLAGVPLAAPSANASTRPSTTTAAHVERDLDGRITTIIDGGPCEVGVESTVVDGLSDPPLILRPGGISMEQLKTCPGWENVQIAYKDTSEKGAKQPKAPGMKYRHYSPKARVILYESTEPQPDLDAIAVGGRSFGVIRTRNWKSMIPPPNGALANGTSLIDEKPIALEDFSSTYSTNGSFYSIPKPALPKARKYQVSTNSVTLEIWDIDLGHNAETIARGLFSALREFDDENVETILVEGIDDKLGNVAAAVMNRLRKAAETQIGAAP